MKEDMYFCYRSGQPVTKELASKSFYQLTVFPRETEVVLKSNGCAPQFYKDSFRKIYSGGAWIESYYEPDEIFPPKNPDFTKLVWSKGCEYEKIFEIQQKISNLKSKALQVEIDIVNLEKQKEELYLSLNIQK